MFIVGGSRAAGRVITLFYLHFRLFYFVAGIRFVEFLICVFISQQYQRLWKMQMETPGTSIKEICMFKTLSFTD